MGNAYAKFLDEDGIVRYAKFAKATYQPELPVALLCVNKFLFRDDGTETNMDVDFKKSKMYFNLDTSSAYTVNLHRACDLPIMQLSPLDEDDLDMLRGKKQTVVQFANLHVNKMSWQTLHNRFGHCNDEYLKRIVNHNMVAGLEGLDAFPEGGVRSRCEACYLGDMHRRQVRKQTERKLGESGTELFLDFGGPWPTKSLNKGNRKWLLIRERHGSHMAIYFFDEPTSETCQRCVEQYLKEINKKRNDLGCVHVNVELLASDVDSKLVSNSFKQFLHDKWIKQVVMPPYTHAMMGAVESYMKYVKQGTLKLREQSGFPNAMWEELMSAYVYQRNRSYTSVCNKKTDKYKTPHARRFPGEKPDAREMVTIGSKTYVYIDKEEQRMNIEENHCWIGYVCGYSKHPKAYRVYDPVRNAVYDVYHVLFDERVMYKDERGSRKETNDKVQKQLDSLEADGHVPLSEIPDGPLKDFVQPFVVEREAKVGDRVAPSVTDDEPSPGAHSSANSARGKKRKQIDTAARASKRTNKGKHKPTFEDEWTNEPDSKWTSHTSVMQMLHMQIEIENQLDEYEFVCLMAQTFAEVAAYHEPKDIYDAWSATGELSKKWREASDEEVDWMVDKNVVIPVDGREYPGANVLKSGWVFKTKRDSNNDVKRLRARFFPKGCSQIESVDYQSWNTNSPVMQAASLRLIFSIACQYKMYTRTIDIGKAFSSGDLTETVLSQLPPGYRENPKYAVHGTHTLWLYKRAAYGLRQAAHNFHVKYIAFLVSAGFTRMTSDTCVLFRRDGEDLIVIGLWVDDNVIAYSNRKLYDELIAALEASEFEYRDEGTWSRILGMDIKYDREGGELTYSHGSYIMTLLATLGLENLDERAIPVKTTVNFKLDNGRRGLSPRDYKRFRTLLGGIGHVARWTHPEISYAVSVVSQVMNNPGEEHNEYLMDIARYLKKEKNLSCVIRRRATRVGLIGYTDADWARCPDTRRSRCGFAFFLEGNLIGCQSKMQKSTALSTAEAEYVGLTYAITYAVWIMQFLDEIDYPYEKPVVIYADNQAAIAIASNASSNHRYTKHIDIKYKYCKEIVRKGEISVIYLSTDENLADIFTKALAKKKFVRFRDELLNSVLHSYPRRDSCIQTLERQFEIDEEMDE